MKGLRVVFMGTPEFAIPALEKIHASHHQLVGIVSQPDRPRGRGRKLSPSPVKQYALEHHLQPLLQPQSLKDPAFIKELRDLGGDVFVVVAFRILPEAVFTMPPRGTVNLHPSLLPKYRGAAPIHWTIIGGERKTGITTIFIQKQIDAGNIILQREYPVLPDDTAGTLHDRLAPAGASLLLETLALIAQGEVRTAVQDEKQVTAAPKITKEMCHLRFDQPAGEVRNWIHGLSPYPGGFVLHREQTLKLYLARVISSEPPAVSPGTVIRAEGEQLWLACRPGIVAILELQLQGRKRLQTRTFLSGYSIEVGEVFE